MTRWKISPSSHLLFAAFLYTLLASSYSASLSSIPSWTHIRQLQTRGPEFNVVSTDDGVPALESGEKPAKDPQIITGPLPVETPDFVKTPNPSDPFDDGELLDSTPTAPSQDFQDSSSPHPKDDPNTHYQHEPEPSIEEEKDPENHNAEKDDAEGPLTQSQLPKPSKATQSDDKVKSSKKYNSSKKPKPSPNPVSDTDQESDIPSGSGSGNLADDEDLNVAPSPEDGNDIGLNSFPELSALPDYPSASKPPNSPLPWPSTKPSKHNKPKQSNSVKSPNAAEDAGTSLPKEESESQSVTPMPTQLTSEEGDTGPEPSFQETDGPLTSLPPTETLSVPSPSNSLAPTAIIPSPVSGSESMSDSPPPLVPSASLGSNDDEEGANNHVPENSSSIGNDESHEKGEDEIIHPNGTYTCVNFAGRTFGNYQLFDESAIDGSYTTYKGSGVARNPTLPKPYRYHVYGKNWTYHLNVLTNSSQDVILGFAEVFPKACASGKNGSFRVFTVSVGETLQIIDVMESSGCGVVLQAVFENVKPQDQMIDLSFNSLSGRAMISVACYGKTRATNTPKPDTSLGQDGSGTPDEASKQSQEQCFHFGEKKITGFTNFPSTSFNEDVQVYTDKFVSVTGTPYPEIYKSHIFGTKFALILEVGSVTSKTVELGFAEIYSPGCDEGFREFTVQSGAESRTVDVFKEVGCNTVFTFQLANVVPNPSGKIEIVFKSTSNFAMVSSVCIIDDNEVPVGTSLSVTLVVSSEGDDSEEALPHTSEESNKQNISVNPTPLPYDESSTEQSTEPDVEEYPNTESPQGSPYPKVNGIIDASITISPTVTKTPTALAQPALGSDEGNEHSVSVNPTPLPNDESSTEQSTEPDIEEYPSTEPPQGSPYPKVNGIIDASVTISPIATETPTALALPPSESGDSGGANGEEDPPFVGNEVPKPSDELLPSNFSQTTLGEDPNSQPTNVSSSSSSQPGLSGASGNGNFSSTPTPSVNLNSTASPVPSSGDGAVTTAIVPTRTPIATFSANPSIGGSNDSVIDKQSDDVTIEAPSPSPSALTVEIEAPSPSASGLIVTIEAPSPSSSPDSVTVIGTEPATSESGVPTPTIISAAAFSPVPSPAISPSSTPQPLETAAMPDTVATESPSPQSTSPVGTPTTGDEVLPPADSTPTETETLQPSLTSTPNTTIPSPTEGISDETVILPPVNSSPGPQGGPDRSGPPENTPSPPPAATVSQNQIVVIPSASALPVPIQTPTPAVAVISPSPPSTQVANPDSTASGIGPPGGVVSGSIAPDSTAPNGSPIPDVLANPTTTPESSPQSTPSPSRATSSVGSGQVIVDVDSPTSGASPEPVTSTSAGAPDEGPVEVSDNTTEIIQVTGDTGTEADNQPSILVGEYKDLIATTPVGSGFAIGMGILGSLLVILLLVCLFFAIFRGGGAAYSYSSGYSSHKPTDDPSQGRYTDDLGLEPTGYGNEPSYGENTQDGYGGDPVTFESRPEGQSEAFGFEMPAAGGFGAPDDATQRNEEPDTTARYSSLNLQPSGYDSPGPETTDYRESRQTFRTDKTRTNASYASNPGEYTFTGTFTMPDTGYSQSQIAREHEDYRDPGPVKAREDFRGSPAIQDSFNDHHSIARPTMMSESSGKQGRFSEGFTTSEVIENSSIVTGVRTEPLPTREEGTLVDDIRSSLLDSEQATSSYVLSMGSNPPAAQSPYETQLNVNMDELESGNVVQRDLRFSAHGEPAHHSQTYLRNTQQVANQDTELPAHLFNRDQNEPVTGTMQSAQTDRARRSVPPSSVSNDEPWPWWWSRENMGQRRKATHKKSDQMGVGKENSPLPSNGMMNTESYQHSRMEPYQKLGAQVGNGTPVTPKSAETQTNQCFVPDSSWCRQYSSTSDEAEDEMSSNPYFEELRRRREPYVRSVANRLSTGPGSFSMSAFGESDPEEVKDLLTVKKRDEDVLRSARDVSSWITRDPVEV